jgi:CspA family cold shock protein
MGTNGSFSFGRMLKNLFGKPEPASEMGAVKWFDAQKGFGFIERPDGSDIFDQYSDIVGSGFRTLTEGQKVAFQVSQSPKGPQAVNVQRVEGK